MQEGDDEPDEYAIRALTIWQSCTPATNEFFIKLGQQVVAFGKDNDLTTSDLAAHLGHLTGTLAVFAVQANPEHYEKASDDYQALATAALELSVAMMLDKHERPKSQAQRKCGGPTNG